MLTAATGNSGNKAAKDLENFLDILKNKDIYDKRLKELQQKTIEFNAARNELTQATDLNAALAEANNQKDEAARRLAAAKEKSANLVSEAQTKASEIMDAARASRDAMRAEEDKAREDFMHYQSRADVIIEEAQKFLADAKNKQSKADIMRKEAKALNDEMKRKIKTIQERLSSF